MARLSDQVVADLRRAIVDNEYEPGSRLPTAEALSESMGVSRSVVRDALRTLSSMGLVEVRHGHGIFVALPRDDVLTSALTLRLQRSDLTVGEVFDARIALESALAAEAARIGDTEAWALMHKHLDEFETAVRGMDWSSAHRAHLDFHLSIIRALRLPALELILEPLQELIIVSSIPTEPESAERWGLGSHDPIMRALESGDAEATRTAVQGHFAYVHTDQYRDHTERSFREARTAAAQQLSSQAGPPRANR